MNRTHSLITSAFLAAALLPGCGSTDDDSSGGGGGSVSGAPVSITVPASITPTKQLKDLNDVEARALCDAGVAAARERITDEQFCKASSALAGAALSLFGGEDAGKAGCESALASCDANEEWKDDCDLNKADKRAGCTATITEIEACYEEQLGTVAAILGDVASEYSCSELPGLDALAGLDGEPGAACASVKTKCPKLFEDDDEAPSGASGASGTATN